MVAGPGGVEAGRVAVRVLPDTSAFARSLQRYLTRIEARTVLNLRADLDGERLVEQARRIARTAQDATRVRLPVDVDAAGVVRETRRVAAVAEKTAKVRLPVELDTKRLAAGAARLGSLLLSGARLAVTVAALAGVVVQAVNLVAALAPAAGILAAIPALAVGAAAAVGVLRLAFAGVADAIKGDPEALAKLAPAARSVVGEIRALQPALDGIRTTVQQAVFAPLIGQVSDLARTWLPLLKSRLADLGESWGQFLAQVAEGARTPQFVAGIDAALRATDGAVGALRVAVVPLMQAVGAVVGAFSPAMTSAAISVAGLAREFAAFILAAQQSGQLAAFVAQVATTLRQIGGILVQLGGIVAAVVSAAQSAGGGLLGSLQLILTQVNAFLSAGEGHSALQAFFAATSAALHALLPIVLQLVAALGPALATLLGPQGLAGALTALAPAAGPVGEALGAIARAAAPLLVLIGALAGRVLSELAGMIAALLDVLGPMIGFIAQAATAVEQALLPAILALIRGGLPAAVALGTALTNALAPLVPVIAQLATLFVSNVLPALQQVEGQLVGALLPVLAQAAAQIGGALLDALQQLAPYIPALAQAAAEFAVALVQVLIAAAPLIPVVAGLFAQGLSADGTIAGIRLLTGALTFMAQSLTDSAARLAAVVTWLIMAKTWAEQTAGSIAAGFGAALAYISELPARVRAVFDGARSWLVDAGRNIVDGLLDGIRGMFAKAVAAARELGRQMIGAAKDALGIASPSTVFAGIGHDTVAGFVLGVENAQPVAARAMSALATPPDARPFGLTASGAGPVGPADPVVNLTALVRIGDGPVLDAVETAVSRDPERFAQHVRTGERGLTRRG